MYNKISNSTLNKKHQFFQAKRLLQIFWAVELSLVLIFIQRIYLNQFYESIIVGFTSLILFSVYRLAKNERVEDAASVLLIVITLMVTYFMWKHGGLYDEVVLAYPSILIVAAMLGSKELFKYLFIIIISSVALNGILNEAGIYTNTHLEIEINASLLIILIFTLISYTIWVMSSDFRNVLEQLHKENNEVKKSKSEIEKLLRHDILTSLPNRLMAEEYFKKSVSKSLRNNSKVHLMFIDLDNFKLMNDALGHQAGDQLLIEISTRLKGIVRENDVVCRFAGDEFIIIFEQLISDDLIASISQKIISTISLPFYYKGNEFICGCSIGISAYPNDGSKFDTLLRNSDTAMYYSKSVGGNSFHYFNEEMNTHGHEYLNLITDLRQAIKNEEFFLVYQPKINLKTNKVIGAEALLRWNHPTRGVIFPDFFIEQAEKSGLIVEIGEWVIQKACRECSTWIEKGYDNFSIAVNVSSEQFSRGNICEVVKSALEISNLSGRYLELEMTESLLIDNSDKLKNTFKYIQNLGVCFSVDDFGTGYSNLGYLKEFDITSLKIDRSFIVDIENNKKNNALVKAIIQMARGLELYTVAEGIEDIDAANRLTKFKCDFAQGYFWSKPILNHEFLEFSKKFNKLKL